MPNCDFLIRDAIVFDGSGCQSFPASVGIAGDRICAVGELSAYKSRHVVDGAGKALAPGFIDVHTHDDLSAIHSPQMLSKLSQGVTTVVVGNCGISAAPARLKGIFPDPMNLLGDADGFCYPSFRDYVNALEQAQPALNVAALVGHTSLRNNHMSRLDRAATAEESEAMHAELYDALDSGALGLSTGLAYLSANSASTEEILNLVEALAESGAVYTTHLRSETDKILDALDEAFLIGRHARVPVIVPHLKCAGVDNWGRSAEVLQFLRAACKHQAIACDCYPYAASSSTLDLRQVDERVTIRITWSSPHPEWAGHTLAEIAEAWSVPQVEAARRLQPAGAIYHGMSEEDVCAILRYPETMIGSDGLPNDPRPHPRLWGTFPRVLGRYSRELGLFTLAEAVHKMSGLPASRFGFQDRGLVRAGYYADLVLFDAKTVHDDATFEDPVRPAVGIASVWVNGSLSYQDGVATGQRAGRFLPRSRVHRRADTSEKRVRPEGKAQ